jgi:uncharacterized protein YqgV (UPF0045/DUF77 family)
MSRMGPITKGKTMSKSIKSNVKTVSRNSVSIPMEAAATTLELASDISDIALNTVRGASKAVRIVNQHFKQLKVAQAPDKPFIGRIEKGFDFLGYRFGQEKLSVSKRTLENHIRRLSTTLGYMGLCSYSVVDA